MIVSPGWGSWPEANWMIFCEVCRNWDTPVQGLWPFWPCDPHNPETGTMSTNSITIRQIHFSIITGVCWVHETRALHHCHLVVWAAMSPLLHSELKAVPQIPSTCIQPLPNEQHHSASLKCPNVERPSAAFTLFKSPACWLWATLPIQEQKWHSLFYWQGLQLDYKVGTQ